MKLPVIAGVIAVLLALNGCATAQRGAMIRARSDVLRGNYPSALARLDAATRHTAVTPELQAEIAYLRAESLAGLGDKTAAEGLYRHVIATYPETPWRHRSEESLKALHGIEVAPGLVSLAPTWGELVRWLTTPPADAHAALDYATHLSEAEDRFAGDLGITPADLRDLYIRALPMAPFEANQTRLRDRFEHLGVLTQPWTPEQALAEIEHNTRVVASPSIRAVRLTLLGLYAQRRHLADPSETIWAKIALGTRTENDHVTDAGLMQRAMEFASP